jgi:hypothetical protein
LQKGRIRINKNNQDSARIEVRGYYLPSELTRFRAQTHIDIVTKMLNDSLRFESKLSFEEAVGEIPEPTISHGSLQLSDTSVGFQPDAVNTIKISGIKPINLETDLTINEAKLRRMPSAQAWANSADVRFGSVSGIPINSIDVFLVIEKSRRGDKLQEGQPSLRPDQADVNNCNEDVNTQGAVPSSLNDASSPTSLAVG